MTGGLTQKTGIEVLDVSGLYQLSGTGRRRTSGFVLPKSWTTGRDHCFSAGVQEERWRYPVHGRPPRRDVTEGPST